MNKTLDIFRHSKGIYFDIINYKKAFVKRCQRRIRLLFRYIYTSSAKSRLYNNIDHNNI